MLHVSNLSFEYPGARALDDVSFAIAPGEITALVGPNGAGKTTLMRCVAALDRPYSGDIRLEGLDVHEDPRQAHRRMGYLSDFFGLYDQLTVRQCLTYFARAQGVSNGVEAAVESTASAVSLSDRLDNRAETLSRGLRQRLAIGQAIIHNPDLLILDEPASGLDPEARQDLSQLLLRLRDQGMTIIVSSHILAELAEYSTHMLVLDQGRLVEHSPIGGVTPDREFVMVTLAEPTENQTHRLVDWLAGQDVASDLRTLADGASFQISGGPAARRDLLAQMIAADFPVCGFDLGRENLQDAYLNRMATHRRGGAGEGS